MIWRPPGSSFRGPRPPLIDLTRAEPGGEDRAGIPPPPPEPPEPERDAALIAERDEARRQAKAATSAMKQAVAAFRDEHERRLAAEAEARSLRQRVEQAEASARRAARFADVARGALRPETFAAIEKLAAARRKPLPRAAGEGHDGGDGEPRSPGPLAEPDGVAVRDPAG